MKHVECILEIIIHRNNVIKFATTIGDTNTIHHFYDRENTRYLYNTLYSLQKVSQWT